MVEIPGSPRATIWMFGGGSEARSESFKVTPSKAVPDYYQVKGKHFEAILHADVVTALAKCMEAKEQDDVVTALEQDEDLCPERGGANRSNGDSTTTGEMHP